MQNRNECLLCGGDPDSVAFERSYDDPRVEEFVTGWYTGDVDYSLLRDEVLRILRCEACRFYWHQFVLGDEGMADLYGNWISTDRSWRIDDTWSKRSNSIEKASHLASYFEKRPSQVKVLSFGMGWAPFLEAAGAYGCEVHGYEISEERLSYARERGIDTHSTWNDLRNHEFDFVEADQVLEHVPNPTETAELLSEIVSADGLIYAATPTASVPPTRDTVLTKGIYQPPEHVNAFEPPALESLFERHGLSTINVRRSLTSTDLNRLAREAAKRVFAILGIHFPRNKSQYFFRPDGR